MDLVDPDRRRQDARQLGRQLLDGMRRRRGACDAMQRLRRVVGARA
jgi:hypothetical protein